MVIVYNMSHTRKLKCPYQSAVKFICSDDLQLIHVHIHIQSTFLGGSEWHQHYQIFTFHLSISQSIILNSSLETKVQLKAF